MDYNMPRPRKDAYSGSPKTISCKDSEGNVTQVSSKLYYPACMPWTIGCTAAPAWLPAVTVCRGY